MISAPPSETGTLHDKSALAFLGVAVSETGAPGTDTNDTKEIGEGFASDSSFVPVKVIVPISLGVTTKF